MGAHQYGVPQLLYIGCMSFPEDCEELIAHFFIIINMLLAAILSQILKSIVEYKG